MLCWRGRGRGWDSVVDGRAEGDGGGDGGGDRGEDGEGERKRMIPTIFWNRKIHGERI